MDRCLLPQESTFHSTHFFQAAHVSSPPYVQWRSDISALDFLTQSFIAAGAVFLILTRFRGGQMRPLSLVMPDSRVVIGLQATKDTGAATTNDAAGFLRPGRRWRICFWMFGLAMLSSENQTACMASGTVACSALVRNRTAFSTISRCRVVFLAMLGGQGNSVVEIFNRYY